MLPIIAFAGLCVAGCVLWKLARVRRAQHPADLPRDLQMLVYIAGLMVLGGFLGTVAMLGVWRALLVLGMGLFVTALIPVK